jgi:hypothetical protein
MSEHITKIDSILTEVERDDCEFSMSHFNTETLDALIIYNKTLETQKVYLGIFGGVTKPTEIMDLNNGECIRILPVRKKNINKLEINKKFNPIFFFIEKSINSKKEKQICSQV